NTLSLRSLGSGVAPTPGAVEISGVLNLAGVGVLDMQGASVTQTGGTLTVAAVSGAASAGDFTLQQSGNTIGALGAASASGAVNIRTGGTLTVNGPVDANATSTLRADGGLVLNGNVDVGAANTLNLRTDGAVTQPGGVITAGTLDVRGGEGGPTLVTGMTLDRANVVGSLFVQSLGNVTFRDADGFAVAGIGATGQIVDLRADVGDITQSGAITAGSLRARALDGAVVLNTQANAIAGAVAGSAAGGSNGFAVRDDNGLLIGAVAGTNGISAPGVVDLLADAGSITQTQAIGAGSLRARAAAAGASVDLNDATNLVGTLAGRADGDFLFLNGQTLTIGTVAGTAGVQSATGQVALESTAIAVQAGVSAATTIDLLATTGSITQNAAGVLTVPELRARASAAGASVLLDDATSQVGTVAGRASVDFEFLDGQALTVGTVLGTAGIVATTGHVALTATAVGVAAATNASTFLDLRATTGSITQGAAGILTAAQLRARAEAAGASVLLDGAANQVGALAARANVDVAFLGGQALTIDTVQGTAGVQAATGAVMLGAPSFHFAQGASAATQIDLRASTGGITQDATGILTTPLLTGQSALATDLGVAANQVDRLGTFRAGVAASNATEAGFALRSAQSLLTVDGLVAAGFTTGDVQQAAGGRLSLFADDMDILAGSSVRAAAGIIELAPHSAGRAVVLGADLGGPPGGALFLNNAEIGRLSTWNRDAVTPRFGLVAVGSATAGDLLFGGDVDLRVTGASATPTDFAARGLVLRTGGTVTQSTGRLNVEQLGVAAGGSVTLDGANLVNRIAALDGLANGAEATGAITLRVNATLPEIADALTGFTSFFTVPSLVVGADIVANDPVGAALPGITLVADDLQLGARLVASGGTVTLRPVTAGRTVLLGFAADPTTALHLSAAEIAGGNIDVGAAGVLRIGAVATDLRVAGPLEGTRTPAAGDIQFGEQNLVFGGAMPRLELFSSGDITQTTGTLSVGSVAGLAGGRVAFGTLGAPNANAIGQLALLTDTASFDTSDGFSAFAAVPGTAGFRTGYAPIATPPADGSFSLTTDSALTVLGDVVARGNAAPIALRGQSIALQAALSVGGAPGDVIDLLATGGSITQNAAGVLTAPALRARAEAAGGSVLLDDATSQVATFAARANVHVEFLGGQALTVGTVQGTAGVVAATGHVVLTAPSLDVAAAVTASTFIDLLATTGSITQGAAGVLTAAQLRARAESAGASVLLDDATNQIGTLAARADVNFDFLNGQTLTFGTVLGTTGVSVGSGRLGLGAPSLHITQAMTAATAIDLLATTGSITQDSGGVLTAPLLRARAESAGASVLLDDAANQVGTLAVRAAVDMAFSGGQALTIGTVLGTAGVAAAGGQVSLSAPSVNVLAAVGAGTAIDLLASAGDITQNAAGVLTAPQLRARAEAAGASVLLDVATNQVGTVAGRADADLRLLTGQALTVGTVLGTAGVAAATGHVELTGPSILLSAATNAADFIDLLATTGSITQGAGGVLTAPALRARAEAAGASVLLDDATNQVGTFAARGTVDVEFLGGQALAIGTVRGTAGIVVTSGHVAVAGPSIQLSAATDAAT
ncbi:MAG: hypothetical protein IT561_23320, partial [Alphaproteobacteria bacterium]|nr:hypothetical protein [Alphaproteobacteria bacterium]